VLHSAVVSHPERFDSVRAGPQPLEPPRSEPPRSEPPRPEPRQGLHDRVREQFAALLDRVRQHRQSTQTTPGASGPEVDQRVVGYGGDKDSSLLVTGLVALGTAMLAIGGFWAWQTWTQRSDEPIDGLLPELVVTGDPGTVSSGDATTDRPDNTNGAAAANQVAIDAVADTTEGVVLRLPGDNDSSISEASEVALASTPVPDIIVHVSGAVRLPGVVRLAAGSRVFEAVELSGGAAADADLDRVNLAAPMADGERIHIPAQGDDSLPVVVQPDRPHLPVDDVTMPSATPTVPMVININRASSIDFMTLPGIGPSIAAAITKTRAERGPFLSIDELLEVPGIGEAKLSQLRPFVLVGES